MGLVFFFAGAGALCAERLTLEMVAGSSVVGQKGAAMRPTLIAIKLLCRHQE